MGCKCGSYITQGRSGEKGSWCVKCGEKVWEVETRPCGDCIHYSPDPFAMGRGGSCLRHLMRVTASMLVTYDLSAGTCWRDPRDIPRGLMGSDA
ncbi:hypothetical protein D9M70_474560 [compost metagenome]